MLYSLFSIETLLTKDLTCRSNADLTVMEQITKRKLESLRRTEPGCPADSAAYCVWIGRNVRCIEALQRLRREQGSRARAQML